MTQHIVCLMGEGDRYTPETRTGDEIYVVPFEIAGHPESAATNLPTVFAENGLQLPPEAEDVVNAALAVYTADLRAPRRSGFDGWTRDLHLHLAVRGGGDWDAGGNILRELLSFLTGDHWKVSVRPTPKSYAPAPAKKPRSVRPLEAETVCLFSGGLDSYIGAVDAVSGDERIVLVGHYKSGDGPTSKSQDSALAALRKTYPEEQTPFLKIGVTPPREPARKKEPSTRGRSIMFVGLAVAVASGLGARRVIVPENGLISLNVPLTNARMGSFSTRTTHPHLMRLMRELLAAVGVRLEIDLPYRFKTKGEMVSECADRQTLKRGLDVTMSCSHPAANRFGARNPNVHCGRCVPCVIRRAAIKGTFTDPTRYVVGNLRQPPAGVSGADLRALRIALDRYERRPPRLADVLAAGPLPGSDDDLREYREVFWRGIAEVGALLNGKPRRRQQP